MASMLANYRGKSFALSIKSWVLISWCFQTLGIIVGSIWAYYELEIVDFYLVLVMCYKKIWLAKLVFYFFLMKQKLEIFLVRPAGFGNKCVLP